jgi:hypothetical protein
MHVTILRRVGLGALACLVALAAVAPVAADSRIRKIEPRRTVPYKLGRVFTPNTDVLSVSGYAAWMIDEVLETYSPLPRLGAAFTRAEREEGINARYFLAHAILESGWGTSAIARRKHNLFGYSAFDRDPWKYATRYKTYQQGIRAVAEQVRDGYLTPGGRWWYQFTTPRAINRYYASDPRWADKVAHLANVVDQLIVTLRERDLHFGRPTLSAAPAVGDRITLDLPWEADPGAVLPSRIRFAVRWTPVALLEATPAGPTEAPAAGWRLVRRTDRPGDVVRLAIEAPAVPGAWRLDVEARDSDGLPLPATDRPAIHSQLVRVTAPQETAVSFGLAADGMLEATVRNPGRAAVEATGATGVASILEAWAFPLDPAMPAYRLTATPLATPLEPGASRVVPFGAPIVPSVVVVRLTGDPATLGRTLPVAAVMTRGDDGQPALTPLAVASPRDDALLGRVPGADRIALAPLEAPASVRVAVTGGTSVPEIGAQLAAMEDPPGRPSLLVRSLAAEPDHEGSPTDAHLELPTEPPTPALVELSGLPDGIRLVMASIVPADGGPADIATIRLAWIPVAGPTPAEASPN